MRLALYLSGATPEHARRVESALEATPFQVRQTTKAASLFPRKALRDFVVAMAVQSASSKSGVGRGWEDVYKRQG